MPSVENAKQDTLSTNACCFRALTEVVVDVDGHMFNLEVMPIGSNISFSPIWIMQYVFCRHPEPKLTYAPAQSLAQSSMVRFW